MHFPATTYAMASCCNLFVKSPFGILLASRDTQVPTVCDRQTDASPSTRLYLQKDHAIALIINILTKLKLTNSVQ